MRGCHARCVTLRPVLACHARADIGAFHPGFSWSFFASARVFGDTTPAIATLLNNVLGGNLCKNNVSGFRGYEFFSTEPFAADNLAVEGSYDPYFKQTVTLDTSCT